VRHVVARHLRTRNEDRLPLLTEDMLRWMGSYGVPAGSGRWSTGAGALLDGDVARALCAVTLPQSPPAELARLPRGRHGLAPGVVARSQRARIIQATAQVTMEKGYASTTVADIVSAAGVAKEAFYRHFSDKEEAFLDAQQHPSQYVLETVFDSYCSAEQWHERIWRALRTLLGLVVESPVLAHLRLVECYAAGPRAIRLAEDATRSFGIFLAEGYGQSAEAGELPRLCSETIAAAIFALIQHDVTRGAIAELPSRLPQLAYVAIAPYLGPQAARELLEEKIARDSAAARRG
jgi:AcrR family transcriptional regulator